MTSQHSIQTVLEVYTRRLYEYSEPEVWHFIRYILANYSDLSTVIDFDELIGDFEDAEGFKLDV